MSLQQFNFFLFRFQNFSKNNLFQWKPLYSLQRLPWPRPWPRPTVVLLIINIMVTNIKENGPDCSLPIISLAIFAITSDPFIVLTSNVFAILGLRAMYFLLAAVADKFHLLNYGLAVILVFIGGKMCLIDVYKIPVLFSLGVVMGILALTMLLSVRTAPARSKE